MLLALAALGLAPVTLAPADHETVTFPSADGLEISADLYRHHDDPKTPFIVLFHQAGMEPGRVPRDRPPASASSASTASRSTQRSGEGVNDVRNETAARAKAKGAKTTYVDALPDMVAALEHAREHHAEGKVLAWGSSYSAALVLLIASEHPELVDGALAFAPGEYFARFDKPATWIADAAARIRCPVFVTSARNEHKAWKAIFAAIPEDAPKTSFLPEAEGNHGSRALWKKFEDSAEYLRARWTRSWSRSGSERSAALNSRFWSGQALRRRFVALLQHDQLSPRARHTTPTKSPRFQEPTRRLCTVRTFDLFSRAERRGEVQSVRRNSVSQAPCGP